jgi:hypothetical protein
MPILVERAVDEPIVRFVFEGMLDAETVQEANTQMAALLEELGSFYAVIDIRGLETTFGEAAALLEGPNSPSVVAEPRIKFVYLGQTVPDDPTNQQRVPVFKSKEAAFDFIRQEIAKNALPDAKK